MKWRWAVVAFSMLPAFANADTPSPLEVSATRLALDFCASTVGADLAKAKELLSALPEFELQPASKASSAKGQEMLSKLLRLDADEPFFRVTLRKPLNEILMFAAFRTDFKTCAVTVVGPSEVGGAIRTRASNPASGWTRIVDPLVNQSAWQLKRGDQVVTMTVVSTPGSTVIGVDTTLEEFPAIAEFDQFSTSLIEPCVKLVLSGGDLVESDFVPPFEKPEPRQPNGNTYFRAYNKFVAAGLAIVPESIGSTCVASLDSRGLPHEQFISRLKATFQTIPGMTAGAGSHPHESKITDAEGRSALMRYGLKGGQLIVIIKRE